MIWGEWAQPGGSSDSEDADWGHTCECIQLRVWWKLGYPRWSPLLQGSLQMASNHAMSWPGLHSMRLVPQIEKQKMPVLVKPGFQSPLHSLGQSKSQSKARFILMGRIAKNIELNQCVSTLTNTDPQALSPVILTYWSEVGPEPQYLS